MRPAFKLLQRGGFLKRTFDEFKSGTHKVFSMQGVTGNFDDMEIHSFRHPSSLDGIVTFSDADIGGFSKAKMDLEPFPAEEGGEKQSYGRFHGNVSIELPPDRPNVQRSGYAAWRTVERGRSLFGRPYWNIDPYAFLALRIKSDGSKYFINIQTESIVESDLHQHRLFSKTPGEWEVIHIPTNEFVRTNHGRVTEPQGEMLREKVRTIGIGLIDRIPGPFELCIDRIWATNHADSVPMPKPHWQVHKSPKMITDID